MTQKFVVRLMTGEGDLLGSCVQHLSSVSNRGEGWARFGHRGLVSMLRIHRPGLAKWISIHWADLDLVRKQPILGGEMEIPESAVGQDARFTWTETPWGVSGTANTPMPPVPVGDVVLSPGPAQMGVRDPRVAAP